MRQLVNTVFISNNCPSFHLWWKENFVKHRKVSKYCETDCGLRYGQCYNLTEFLGYWRMVGRVELNFILVIYNNASQLTYFLIEPLAIARRVPLIRSALLSGWFLGIGFLVFSETQYGIRGPYGIMTGLGFLKK